MERRSYHPNNVEDQGFTMVIVLMMMTVLLALLGTYSVITRIELGTNKYASDSVDGFYAAEAGLNLRAEQVRQTFLGYNRPSGNSPSTDTPCNGSDEGSGDFACQDFALSNQDAVTYLEEDPSNPLMLTIPLGERYQNLNAQEYRYTVVSKGVGHNEKIEAILELRFKSRLVPMFQFAAFYNKDLEILPGPYMNLAGPIHTNGDLYLNSGANLEIEGQVTTVGSLYRGRKNDSSCNAKPVQVKDPTSFRALAPSCSSRVKFENEDLTNWNGMIQTGVPVVTVPEPEEFDPLPGKTYWDKADLRLVLHLNSSNNPDTAFATTGVEVRDQSDAVMSAYTSDLDDAATCPGSISGRAVGNTTSFYNNREGTTIHILDVDIQALLNCIHNEGLMGASKDLADTSEGGLVFFFTVKGPNSSDAKSNYGVRLKNGAELQSSVSGAPTVKGITVISDQAIYTWGDYNSVGKIPASLLADSYNALSNAWVDSHTTWSSRVPTNTTVNAAILAGTDLTGGADGASGQDSGNYNGGLENYPRFHEQWSKSPRKTFYYKGSFVSLGTPRHCNGAWHYGSPQYSAPNRTWGYDTDFNNAENLPPITPRFVYLRQQLFLREFEQ